VRTFSDFSRNTLDLAVVPAVKQISHLPILVDPSHGTGRRDRSSRCRAARPLSERTGYRRGAPRPRPGALGRPQSITPDAFAALVSELRQITQLLGKTL